MINGDCLPLSNVNTQRKSYRGCRYEAFCGMEDSGINSGIIVCKAGFTKNTATYARHAGIKLVEPGEAVVNDAEYNKDGIIDMNFNVMRLRGEVVSIDFGAAKLISDEGQHVFSAEKLTLDL